MKVLIKATNQVQEVKDSYAVNYLIPRGLAVQATDKVLETMAQEEAKKQADLAKRHARQELVARQLHDKTVTLKVKANTKGELFGGITKQQIEKALKTDENVEVILKEHIKRTGVYPLEVKIGSAKAWITVRVEAS